MPRQYSLHEAKAKLSELVRRLRGGGQPVAITAHGQPVAELRALTDDRAIKTATERHAELEHAGLVHRVESRPGRSAFPLGVRRPGALKRFLAARD